MLKKLLEQKKKEILEAEEREKVKRILCENAYEVVKKELKTHKFFQKVNNKYTSANRKLKIIDSRFQKEIITDIEALRHLIEEELKEQFGRKRLVYYKTDFKQANRLYFPYLFIQGEHREEEGFYKVDIKSCFYSIYSLWGIDAIAKAEINHERKIIDLKYVGRGKVRKDTSTILQLLENEKILRNSVYGLTRSSFYLKIYQNKVERAFFRGKLQNLDLTVLISSLLHFLVSQVKEHLIYWNIDGGIIKASGLEKIKKITEELKLNLKIEEYSKEAIVLGLGSYSIGRLQTEHFKHGICSREEKKENVYIIKNFEEVKKWLKRL